MAFNVLFIYPTPFRITGLPVGIASLAAVLKEDGIGVKIFDTAFYPSADRSQTVIKSERMMTKAVSDEDRYLPENTTRMEDDLAAILRSYRPDLVAISTLEIMYRSTQQICRLIKQQQPALPIVAGGVFPTLSPDMVIAEESIDIVCHGEGESALRELCRRLSAGEPHTGITGLWIKAGGRLYRNPPSPLHDINQLPFPDFSEFDPRMFYKPMQGRMYKMMNIETSRGCYNNCTYCAAPQLRKFFRENGCGRYDRIMNVDRIIEQIHHQAGKYHPEFIYFSSENFLSLSDEDFARFIDAYEEVHLPFWIQTRIETLTRERIAALKEVGMLWLTIGLEHGNEEFRRKVLKRHYSNGKFIEKMDILRDAGIGASLNNMIGFPGETRDLIFDTVRMNRLLYQRNNRLESNVFLFTPYRGCELYDVCREDNLLSDVPIPSENSLSERSVLGFPKKVQDDLTGIIRTFNLYVRLPEEYDEQIRVAEKPGKEGDLMLQKLTKLLAPGTPGSGC